MRDIKFRAWNGRSKAMEIVCRLIGKEYLQITTDISLKENLMQFTGLLDRDGKEIYEGDIVNLKVYLRSGDIRPAVVICESLGYMYLKACDNGAEYGTLHIGEVIGNIHEHKHLLVNESNE